MAGVVAVEDAEKVTDQDSSVLRQLERSAVRASTDVAALAVDLRETFWDVSPNGQWRSPMTLVLEEPLSAAKYRAIGQLIPEMPDLFIAAGPGADPSLSWLEYMPALSGLHLGRLDVSSLEPLEHVPGLRALEFSGVHPSKPSLSALRHIPLLEELELDGQGTDFDVVAGLEHLRVLNLLRSPVRSLEALGSAEQLEFLNVSFGRIRDFGPLARLGRLRGVALWQVGGMTEEHLASLGMLPALEALSLGAMRKIVTLSALSAAPLLRYLTLEGLAGFSELKELGQFPALEEVGFWARASDGADFTDLLSATKLDALIIERNIDPQQAKTLWSQFRGRHIAVNDQVRSSSPSLRIGWRTSPTAMLLSSTRRQQRNGRATAD